MGKKRTTVAVIDAGGRGHALVDKYAESPHVDEIVAVPGNDLIGSNTDKPVHTFQNVKTTAVSEIVEICKSKKVSLVDVAQDNAVERGLVDALLKANIVAVGPTKKAGQIESDKAWSRELIESFDIPQPSFYICHSRDEGIEYIKSQPNKKWFIKASGLAEGKGALPALDNDDALRRIKEMKRFGNAGKVFLIEEWLEGEEFSTFAFCDGKDYQIVGSAQDHKRIHNFDEGENTGGMGCNSPPLVLNSDMMKRVDERILKKTLEAFKKRGIQYKGVLYLGAMAVNKNPYVIEYNARWGDPEAQVLLPSLVNDFFEVSMAIVNGTLNDTKLETDGKSRVVVAGASRGYPGDYSTVKGKQIFGLNEARKVEGVHFYGAGVKVENGKYYASGGRLFYIVGEGKSVIDARQKAYEAMSLIYIEGNNLHYRTDIGWRDVERLRKES